MQVHLTSIDLVAVGTPDSAYGALIGDYERRLGRYVKLRVRELKGEPLQRGIGHASATEAQRIGSALDALAGPSTTVVTLDSAGSQLTSEQAVQRLLAERQLVLVIGGAGGLSPEILARADWSWSLGKATLPHQLARLVVTEQLYRAFRIARGEPYHY